MNNYPDREGLKVIAKKAGGALHILDRFHIMAHLSKAIGN
ncbi:MAG: transposase [Candidatus Thiodiazotropha sp. (ex Lucinoma aequizonata)]|nr:transposase [Candidatus Thiodiazotropha sp. (ex Lucinoma aequizonata)]MCU7902186.1 transposase [Candidatus Thiodiazotropha sp. (ex Lucinoma aequizonata)]